MTILLQMASSIDISIRDRVGPDYEIRSGGKGWVAIVSRCADNKKLKKENLWKIWKRTTKTPSCF
ncbi:MULTISPECIES: hypothetical protein [Brucella]|uniref:hypothetical protein n=1 Tax=Brucella TaxID=234 RepID=UPI0009DE59E8